ncbi:hypothetical protein [Ensifer adhaerens]|nr:hypothetical protein [Ensifer adhaerens]
MNEMTLLTDELAELEAQIFGIGISMHCVDGVKLQKLAVIHCL